jgi:hypothetical protein
MTGSSRLYYLAGQEAGFRKAYIHRARLAPPGSAVRRTMAMLARNASHERLRYLQAAKGEHVNG